MNFFNICTNPTQTDLQNKLDKFVNQDIQQPQIQPEPLTFDTSKEKHQNTEFNLGKLIININKYNDQLTGQAKIVDSQSNNTIFQGMLFKGMRNGFGIQYNKNGQVFYKGQFANNQRNGWGETTYYQGQFKDNYRTGYGILFNGEQFYQGNFFDDKFHGIGIYIKSKSKFFDKQTFKNIENIDQYIISQIMKEPLRIFGQNQGELHADEVYIGEWANNQKCGSGKLWKQGGQYWYHGQFSYGIYHGNGTLHRPNAEISNGLFKKGKFIQ